MVHNVVIVGGNFSGVSEAHYLLDKVFPTLNKSGPLFKLTLVSPSSYTYFKVGAPRALVQPSVIQENALLGSIPAAFAKYPKESFTFIHGTATSLDEATQTIKIEPTNGGVSEAITEVKYDSLIIATGTTSNSPVWTLHGAHTITTAALKEYAQKIAAAKTILIGGGGAAGVETAGEIASAHHPTELTLYAGGKRLLPRVASTALGEAAEAKLNALKVNVVYGVKITGSKTEQDGRTTVSFDNGTSKTVDLYIDATGGSPNSSWLPQSWLDSRGRVVVDKVYLRATNAPKGVYAIGDVASYSKQNVFDATFPVAPLAYTVWEDLAGLKELSDKGLQGPPKPKPYKQMEVDTQLVPVGPSGGVGILFGWRIFSWMVWLIKSRGFFLDKAPKLATGEEYAK